MQVEIKGDIPKDPYGVETAIAEVTLARSLALAELVNKPPSLPSIDPEVERIMQAVLDYTANEVFTRMVAYGESFEVALGRIIYPEEVDNATSP